MVVYEQFIANEILNDKRVNTFTLKARTRLKCQHPPFLFNIVPEVLACYKTSKRNKGYKDQREGRKLFVYDSCIYFLKARKAIGSNK